MFYNDNQLAFWIVAIICGSTTICGLFKKFRLLLGKWIYDICFTRRKNKTEELDEIIAQCEKEINGIQTQIEIRIK